MRSGKEVELRGKRVRKSGEQGFIQMSFLDHQRLLPFLPTFPKQRTSFTRRSPDC